MNTTIVNAISVVSFWGDAPEYEVAFSNNGGCYYQPHGGALLRIGEQYVVVTVDDTSCGDFGSRVSVSVECDAHKWAFTFGTMDDASISPDEELESIWLSAGAVLGVDNLWSVVNTVRDAIDIAARRAETDRAAS